VLNGRGGVSERARSRVLEAAKRLNAERPRSEKPHRWLNVPVLMQSPTIDFYKELASQFRQHEITLDALNVRSTVQAFDSIDPRDIAEQIRLYARHADAMVLATHDHPLVREAVAGIARKCPVITVASDLPASGRFAYVGTDAYVAGRLAGEMMGRLLGPAGGSILVIKGYQHFLSHGCRERGMADVLRERFPQVRIIARADTREDPDSAANIIRDVLRAVPNLRGVYNTSVGDEEIASTLSALTPPEQVVFIAHDLTLANRGLLARGLIDVVLDQSLAEQSGRAFQAILARFGRAAMPSVLLQTTSVVMRESLAHDHREL
jgi:LacI family transcriptional regulator